VEFHPLKSSAFPGVLFRQFTENRLSGETEEVEVIARPSRRTTPTQGEDEERESPEHEASSHSDSPNAAVARERI
jgi:hypothetical protein